MSLLNSATTALGSATKVVAVLGAATGLAAVANKVTGIFSSLAAFTTALDVKLPLPNVLHDYATYNYIIGLGCLSDEEANDPAQTYMAGGSIPLIAKTAGSDPNNRVNTAYGKFDFFIEDLVLEQQVGLESDFNSNVSNFSFNIIEPYSMGMFIIALQQLAQEKGHANWRDACLTLTIQFRGNKETGQMVNIPNTYRWLPIKLGSLDMTVDHTGCKYACKAQAWGQLALTDSAMKLKGDISISGGGPSGASVQRLLQEGEDSLQVALNKRAQSFADAASAKTNGTFAPDQYLILFPNDWSSSGGSTSTSENDQGATTNGTAGADLLGKLKVTEVTKGTQKNLEQAYDDCNVLGQAIIDFDSGSPGDSPSGKEKDVYDNSSGTFFKSKLTADPGRSDFKFNQDSDIPNAINQVLLKSKFIKDTFDASNLSAEGYRKWWRIDPQTYYLPSGTNLSVTGEKPKLYVYRVIPYNVHASRLIAVNTRAPGLGPGGALEQQVVKEYNYIYTGKNQDILKFDILFKNGFASVMGTDDFERNADNVTATSQGELREEASDNVDALGPGKPPEQSPGVIPTIVKFFKTLTNTDKKGGGGPDSPATRAARLFHDSVTNSQQDMTNIKLTIMGDPYYIAHSGIGNFTGEETDKVNLFNDGSINYQNGEVDFLVKFRTPSDINQTTGLYNFQAGSQSVPVIAWSGLYHLNNITSTFSKGQFTQVLHAARRPYQEAEEEGTAEDTYNTNRQPKKLLPPEADE